MKSLMLFALLPLSAFAGNDGPHGQPAPAPMPLPPKPAVIAELDSACGFMCPKGDYRGLRILSGGEVISFSGNRESPEQDVVLARLEADVVARLKADAETLVPGELEDPDKGQPECMDAPTTTYLARRADGTMLKIAQSYGCHEHRINDGSAIQLVETLNGLNQLPRQ